VQGGVPDIKRRAARRLEHSERALIRALERLAEQLRAAIEGR
jgi:hypothetical protein